MLIRDSSRNHRSTPPSLETSVIFRWYPRPLTRARVWFLRMPMLGRSSTDRTCTTLRNSMIFVWSVNKAADGTHIWPSLHACTPHPVSWLPCYPTARTRGQDRSHSTLRDQCMLCGASQYARYNPGADRGAGLKDEEEQVSPRLPQPHALGTAPSSNRLSCTSVQQTSVSGRDALLLGYGACAMNANIALRPAASAQTMERGAFSASVGHGGFMTLRLGPPDRLDDPPYAPP